MFAPFVITAVMAAATGAASNPSSAPTCPAPPPPDVTVFIESSETKVEYRSINTLELILRPDLKEELPDKTHPVGLMQGGFELEPEYAFSYETAASGQSCLQLHQLIVRVQLRPLILLSTELDPRGCMHGAVLAHERKHVVADAALARQFSSHFEPSVVAAQATAPRAPFAMAELPAAQERLVAHFHKTLYDVLGTLYDARPAAQASVDTPEEYEAIIKACFKYDRVTINASGASRPPELVHPKSKGR